VTRAAATRRPGRPAGASGDRTRERILRVALDSFAKQGMAGTSVRGIARQARIRVSTLYHYFPSKEALYVEAQRRVHEQIRDLVVAALGRDIGFPELTREVVGALFDLFYENRSHLELGYRAALDGGPRLAGDAQLAERWLGFVEGTLGPAERRGEIQAIDPVHFMVTIDGLVHWHILNEPLYRRLLGRGFDDDEVRSQTREHVIQVALRTLGLD
jgi:AcrR family transcriptional regulator